MKKLNLLVIAGVFWASISSAGLLMNYPQLLHMDLDQMNAFVKKELRKYKKENSVQILAEAVQAVYSRPDNKEGMIEKVIMPLRTELDEKEQWEVVMESLVNEATGALNNQKAFTPVVLNTYTVFLENVIADYKPFADKPGHERKIIERIRDAKIELSKKQIDERKLRTMANHKSPSEIADDILKNYSQAEANAKKEQEAAAEAAAINAKAAEKAKGKKK